VVDVSVMVQDVDTSQPVQDVRVMVRTVQRGRADRAIEAIASSAAATNKLLQAALVELPESGTWEVDVICTRGSERSEVRFKLDAGESLPEWLSVWPWFTWPLGVVLLFGIHQRLVHRWQRSIGVRSKATHCDENYRRGRGGSQRTKESR